eukprot:GHVT01105088.1.p1 GENE.GHVT01105088.1~~GHVT01105088.1.p1  ORF type:complete len:509 (+),score=73.83 GHVT01105088.1:774-2300(+)
MGGSFLPLPPPCNSSGVSTASSGSSSVGRPPASPGDGAMSSTGSNNGGGTYASPSAAPLGSPSAPSLSPLQQAAAAAYSNAVQGDGQNAGGDPSRSIFSMLSRVPGISQQPGMEAMDAAASAVGYDGLMGLHGLQRLQQQVASGIHSPADVQQLMIDMHTHAAQMMVESQGGGGGGGFPNAMLAGAGAGGIPPSLMGGSASRGWPISGDAAMAANYFADVNHLNFLLPFVGQQGQGGPPDPSAAANWYSAMEMGDPQAAGRDMAAMAEAHRKAMKSTRSGAKRDRHEMDEPISNMHGGKKSKTASSSGKASKTKRTHADSDAAYRDAMTPSAMRPQAAWAGLLADATTQQLHPVKSTRPSKKEKHGSQFTCPECGRCFTMLEHLSNHVAQVHNVVPRIQCPECQLEFRSASVMKRHLSQKHQGKYHPYTCDQCSKGFSRFTHLQRHKSAIHAVAVIHCPVCDTPFNRKDSLLRHWKCKHKESYDRYDGDLERAISNVRKSYFGTAPLI